MISIISNLFICLILVESLFCSLYVCKNKYNTCETELCVPLIYLSSWAIHWIKQILLQHKKMTILQKQFWPHVMYMLLHNKKASSYHCVLLFNDKKKEKKKHVTVHQAFTLESNAQVKPPLLFYLQMQNLSTINNTIKCTQKRLTVHHELKQFGWLGTRKSGRGGVRGFSS